MKNNRNSALPAFTLLQCVVTLMIIGAFAAVAVECYVTWKDDRVVSAKTNKEREIAARNQDIIRFGYDPARNKPVVGPNVTVTPIQIDDVTGKDASARNVVIGADTSSHSEFGILDENSRARGLQLDVGKNNTAFPPPQPPTPVPPGPTPPDPDGGGDGGTETSEDEGECSGGAVFPYYVRLEAPLPAHIKLEDSGKELTESADFSGKGISPMSQTDVGVKLINDSKTYNSFAGTNTVGKAEWKLVWNSLRHIAGSGGRCKIEIVENDKDYTKIKEVVHLNKAYDKVLTSFSGAITGTNEYKVQEDGTTPAGPVKEPKDYCSWEMTVGVGNHKPIANLNIVQGRPGKPPSYYKTDGGAHIFNSDYDTGVEGSIFNTTVMEGSRPTAKKMKLEKAEQTKDTKDRTVTEKYSQKITDQ